MNGKKIKDNAAVVSGLVERSLKIFLKDKASVFFSLLAPLIVLGLYLLFLGDIQTDGIKAAFEGASIEEKLLKNFVDAWMLAGVVSVACVTVSFSVQGITVQDREKGVLNDMLASPISRGIIDISYLISNFVVTLCICLLVLAVAFVYVAITGWALSFVDVVLLIALTIMSVLSASVISTLVGLAFRTSSQHSAFVGIISAVIGFVMGAFMPLSAFPKGVQYVTLFVPATYSAALYRNLFMRGALEKIDAVLPGAGDGLKGSFSMELDFFGKTIGADMQAVIFAAFIALTLAAWIAIAVAKAVKVKKRR